MKISSPGPNWARILDDVAKAPAGAPFALGGPNGRPIFVGTRLALPSAASPVATPLPPLAKPTAGEVFKPAIVSIAAAFGAQQQQAQSVGSTLDAFSIRLKAAQEARRLNPGTEAAVLKLGAATITVHDDVVLWGNLKLVGGAVALGVQPADQPLQKPEEASGPGDTLGESFKGNLTASIVGKAGNLASSFPPQLDLAAAAAQRPEAAPGSLARYFSDPNKANEFANYLGEGVELVPKILPHLEHEMAGAGAIVDVLAIVAGSSGISSAIRKSDNRALVSYSLSLGAGAIDLLGIVTSNATLSTIALFVKFAKTGWTLGFPSNQEIAALR